MKKLLSLFLILSVSVCVLEAAKVKKEKKQKSKKNLVQNVEPAGIGLFRKAYPDVQFDAAYDGEKNDWRIVIRLDGDEKSEGESGIFYWCDGKMLPESEFEHRDEYWSLLYSYPKVLEDPKDFDEARIAKMKEFGSKENRQNSLGSPMFFFDFIYSAESQREIEKHIVRTRFLGKLAKIHERIQEPLKRVEERIKELSETDGEVGKFVDGLKASDPYYWRVIAGTSRKSFHSYGIAVDILPKRLGGKAIFWSWEQDRNPDGWMVLPLSERWMPPDSVIRIFESEGFIWGGKWGVWDNMHFEYHPELILFNGLD